MTDSPRSLSASPQPRGIRRLELLVGVILLIVLSSSCARSPGATNAIDTETPTASAHIPAANAGTYTAGSYLKLRASGVITSPRVMFIGDSLLGGFYASDESDAWSAHVLAELTPEVGDVEVLPAPRKDLPRGTPTSTSSFDISGVPTDLGLAVVELGTNDAGMNVPIAVFAKQYAAILDQIRTTSPDSYILCLSPWPPSSAYTTIIVSACTERARTTYVDISKFFDEPGMRGPAGVATPNGLSDDFHPNDAGHRAIANAVIQALG